MPMSGSRPLTAISDRSSGSVVICAVPLTRIVSSKPGIMNSSPIFGLAKRFDIVSKRLLPGLSGMISVFSSKTFTKPGGSPRGLTSPCPPLVWDPRQMNGDRLMKPIVCSSRVARHLALRETRSQIIFIGNNKFFSYVRFAHIPHPSRCVHHCGPKLGCSLPMAICMYSTKALTASDCSVAELQARPTSMVGTLSATSITSTRRPSSDHGL